MLVKVGVYCLRGNGHWDTYDDPEGGACGMKGPDAFLDVDIEDYADFPEWLQRLIDQHCDNEPLPKTATGEE